MAKLSQFYFGAVSFEDCTFGPTTATSIWSEKGMRCYGPAELKNCEFNNHVVLAGSNDLNLTFNHCNVNNGTAVTDSVQIIAGGNVPAVTIK